MKFSFVHKTVSIVLSFLMLFSTLSLTIEKHFCGDVLIDVAIFSEAEKCGMEVSKQAQTEIENKSCCTDEVDVIKGLSEITINSFEDLDVITQHVLIAYNYSYIGLFEDLQYVFIPHRDYSPPVLIKDICALYETYLI